MASLKIDEELRLLLGELEPAEKSKLRDNLLKDGCRDPIVVWNGTIIDGHNRYEICTAEGIEYAVKEMDFASRTDVLLWMLHNQEGRRNMTPQSLKVLRARLYEAAKSEPGGDRKSTTAKSKAQNGALISGDAAERVAAATGVSRNTVQRDAAWTKALDSVAVRERILGDKLKASVKELEALAELPPAKQRSIVDSVVAGTHKSIAKAMPKPATLPVPDEQGEEAAPPAKAPKSGQPVFDDGPWEKHYGPLRRYLDARGNHYGKDARWKEAIRIVKELHVAVSDWHKATKKAGAK